MGMGHEEWDHEWMYRYAYEDDDVEKCSWRTKTLRGIGATDLNKAIFEIAELCALNRQGSRVTVEVAWPETVSSATLRKDLVPSTCRHFRGKKTFRTELVTYYRIEEVKDEA